MNRYNKISPDVRQELESKLAARFTKTSKTGMAKRLLKGEDVENHLTKTFKEHSDKTTKDIDKKTQDAIVSINQRIDAVLKYMQSVVQAKVDGIRVPEDGRTPSADEIKALLSPMVDETRTQFTQRISKIEDLLTKAPKESDVPTDLKGLEAFVTSKIPKLGGGGGGASYLFELFDTPAKSKSRQGAYVGYEGRVLAVSDDGKSLVFKAGGTGGGHTIEDEGTPLAQRDDLNFVGAGVTVTDAGGKTVVTIPGGSTGSGDVVGPASAVNNNFAAFDTTTGKLIKDSGSKASDFATAAQGLLAASAQQPPSEGAFVDGDKTKLDTYSEANQTTNNAKVTYPSADATKVGHITVTQAVNLDTMESNIATNNAKVSYTDAAAVALNTAKVTNATHTGDVTGATALTIANNAVTNAKISGTGTRSASTYYNGAGNFSTPTNTTYTEISEAEITTGTASTLRTITARRLKFATDAVKTFVAGAYVALTGNQTIAGIKTFSSSPIVPAPTTDLQAATKKYVDDNAGGDLWGDPVDADIIPDVTNTRSIGSAVNKFKETFSDVFVGVKLKSNTSYLLFQDSLGKTIMQVDNFNGASSANIINYGTATTGNAPYVKAVGTDTNVSLNLTTKGTGVVQANGVEVATVRGSVNAQTGTTYTLVIGDEYLNGVSMTNASANTITIPPNSAVAFPVNTKILITQGGAGSTTIAAGAGVTINAPSTVTLAIDEQHESRVCQKISTDTWLLI